MELKNSLQRRRFKIITTFISLASVISVYEYGTSKEWNNMLYIFASISLIVFLVSLRYTFIKTGLWRFTHQPLEKFDERELILINKSLRYAYSFFSIIVLLLLLSFSVIEKPVNIILTVSLIIFAHLLPASVIAWTEKQSDNELND